VAWRSIASARTLAAAWTKGTSLALKRCGSVAWTSFEMSPNGAPRYRAGINFEDADPAAVEAFIGRHKI